MIKDKEWLIKRLENYVPAYEITVGGILDAVLAIAKQLDEPEMLSQEWIEKHKEYVRMDPHGWDTEQYAVAVGDLQNLLVPKQELPVIPQWVADNIESKKRVGTRLNVAMSEFPEFRLERELDIDEHECNEIYARAWLDGYTVEKEPLYRARLKVITDEFIASYLRTQSSDAEDRLKALEIGSKYINEDYRHLSEFTEDELKRLDIWVSEQWEIEELEE